MPPSSEPSTESQVETRIQQFHDTPNNFVRFFTDYLQAIPDEVQRAGCEKVFLLVSSSLDSKTDRISKLEGALGSKVVGKKAKVKAHTPFTDIIDLTQQLWASKADSIVVIGGGSYTDCAKVAMQAHSTLNKDSLTIDAVQSLAIKSKSSGEFSSPSNVRPPTLKLFLIPTMLSAAEYNPGAGATNPNTHSKETFSHSNCSAVCVILDPELCTTTPPRLWLGSGMRAVDHCVEALCADPNKTSPDIDDAADKGLRSLANGLLAAHKDPNDIRAKGTCQVGAWLAMRAVHEKVALGASHAIGHQLGAVANVPHGETSCVMLSSVLKFNNPVNGPRQERVKRILWDVAGHLFETNGLKRENADAGDLIRCFVKALELPTTLREVGVTEEGKLTKIAEYTLTDVWGQTNPRKLHSKEDVMEILRMAA